MATVLSARQLFTPLERIDNPVLVIEDGVVAAVGAREAIIIPPDARVVDLGDSILAPGFIDIHIHGGAGHDVMEGSDESLAAIERMMARARRYQLLSNHRDRCLWMTRCALWKRSAMRLSRRKTMAAAIHCARAPWVFISKGRFSATPDAGCIRRFIFSRHHRQRSTRCGMQPAAGFAC